MFEPTAPDNLFLFNVIDTSRCLWWKIEPLFLFGISHNPSFVLKANSRRMNIFQ